MDKTSMEYSKSDLELQIKLLQDTVQKRQNKTLTLAVIGQCGCGKSSFINTAMAVFSGEYHEHALVGNFENEGEHMTRRLTRYSKEKYLEDKDSLDHCYPTILDMTGFQDTDDEAVRETLGMIFEGRIRDGTKLNSKGRRNVLDIVKPLFPDTKVDRIIFIASAKFEKFPEELMKSVKLLTLEGSRDIPIFGVLTHADEIDVSDPKFCKFEKKFKDCLGLSSMRYLRCTNYCSNFPVDNERIPDVEVPVMRFLRQVIDPAREVYEEERSMQRIYRRMNMQFKTIAVCLLQSLLVFLYLLFIMQPPVEVFEICRARTEHDLHTSNLDHLCSLNADWTIMATPSCFYLFLYLALVYYGVGPLLNFILSTDQNLKALFNQRILSFIKQKLMEIYANQ
nr:uncharacterized protein LOC105335394 isoform X1 [Crassostrea gigas]